MPIGIFLFDQTLFAFVSQLGQEGKSGDLEELENLRMRMEKLLLEQFVQIVLKRRLTLHHVLDLKVWFWTSVFTMVMIYPRFWFLFGIWAKFNDLLCIE